MKDFIKNNLLKKSNSTSDLYLLYYKEKSNFLFSKNVKKLHFRNCSLSGSVNHSPIENNQSRINYVNLPSSVALYICKNMYIFANVYVLTNYFVIYNRINTVNIGQA